MTFRIRLCVFVTLLGCATSVEPRRRESTAPREPYVVDLVATNDSLCFAWSTGGVQCSTIRGPETIRGADGVVSVAAFDHRVCGLTRQGSLVCWNAAHGGVSEASRSSATNATEVVVGSFVACWIRAGRIVCDGDQALRSWTPPGGEGWANLSLGRLHGCGTRDGFGACWGRGDARAVDGSPRSDEDLSVSFPNVLRRERLRVVRAHLARTCAVTEGGALWCFGPLDLLLELDITCALDREGRPHCWGAAINGLLGPNVRAERECMFPRWDAPPNLVPCTSRPTPIDLVRVSKMTSGDHFACAMDEGHNVFCWGSNERGQFIGSALGPMVSPNRAASRTASASPHTTPLQFTFPPSPLPHYEPALIARGVRDVGNGGGP